MAIDLSKYNLEITKPSSYDTNTGIFGSYSAKDKERDTDIDKWYQEQLLAMNQMALQSDIANENLGFQQNAFDYQKELNRMQMEREDTAYQRQVEDLKAAGLSPLAVAGGASTGQYLTGSAPQINSSSLDSAFGNMASSNASYAQTKQARRQLAQQQKLATVNGALQTAQLATDLVSKIQNIKESNNRITLSNQEADWMQSHGYRNQSFENAIIALASNLFSKNPSAVSDKIDEFVEDMKSVPAVVAETVDDVKNQGNAKIGVAPNHAGFFNLKLRANASQLSSRLKKGKWNKQDAQAMWDSSSYIRRHYNYDAWMNYYSHQRDLVMQFE